MAKLLCGYGYLGARIVERWLARGERVYVVTRQEAKAAQLRTRGLEPLVADVARPASLAPLRSLDEITSVVFAVGWDRTPGQSIGQVYEEGLSHVLETLPANVGRFVYISSTGVFGAATGEWVTEETPCHPLREGGQACLAAERRLAESRFADRAIALRMAGIYGPGRIPRDEDLRAGRPIPAPSEGYLNLIHVDDAARIVLLAEDRAAPPRTYLVSDGSPVLRADYYAELARLLDAPPPTFVSPDAASPAAQRAASDKRVSNARLVAELAPTFRYPSYREGLAAIVAERSAG